MQYDTHYKGKVLYNNNNYKHYNRNDQIMQYGMQSHLRPSQKVEKSQNEGNWMQ